MKHLEVINLSAPEESEVSDFDLVLEELEERREFSGISFYQDPGGACCGCGNCDPSCDMPRVFSDCP